MRKLVSISCVVVLLCAVMPLSAQTKIGVKGGMNISNMSITTSGITMSLSSLVGFNVGVVAEIPIVNDLFLQPALLFTTKGTTVKLQSINMTERLDYLEIPINAMYKFKLGSSSKLLLFAGPYIAYGIGGKDSSTGESVKFSGANKDFNAFDCGLNFGPGLEVGNFQLTAQYSLGLANMSPTSVATAKNNAFNFSVAYLFNIEK